MYIVLDIPTMMKKPSTHVRKRQKPLAGYDSTILVRGGTKLDLVPPDSEIRFVGGVWEIHMKIKNKKIVEKLALALDAIAFL